jgi:magnesium chelatase family protein
VLATIPSATLLGVEGRPVAVEVHVAAQGLPSFTVVGLPTRPAASRATACGRAALERHPVAAQAHHRQPGAVGAAQDRGRARPRHRRRILVAADLLDGAAVHGCGFLGELGLDGALRAVPGMVPLVAALPSEVAVVPASSATEAELVGRHKVRPVATLVELVLALRGDAPWPDPPPPGEDPPPVPEPDLVDVRGHRLVRTALELAAAGGHHLLMVGPPGSGKTMLANRLPGILPDLTPDEALEATIVHSAAGRALPAGGLIRRPPLRAPHHGASAVSLIGGGTSQLRPGEVSLATNGVLFLDELGEFPAVVLDSLRQPLEEGVVRVARAAAAVTYPARFLLVGAMNPCPCGEAASPGACRCSDAARQRYQRRLSAPLLDRFDLGSRSPDRRRVPCSPGREGSRRRRWPSGWSQPVRWPRSAASGATPRSPVPASTTSHRSTRRPPPSSSAPCGPAP